MNNNNLIIPPIINSFLNKLFEEESEILEYWLIGSRANNNYTENSDWDILAFINSSKCDDIFKNRDNLPDKLDLIVVLPNGDFVKPFGTINEASLSDWNWCPITENQARYIGQNKMIFDEFSDGGDDFKEQIAIRIKNR